MSASTSLRRACAGVGILLLGGCATSGPPPVIERSIVRDPQTLEYVVARGDTLYSVAWRFDLDYRELARRNGIAPPYLLKPGQRISVEDESPIVGSKVASVEQASTRPATGPSRPVAPADPPPASPAVRSASTKPSPARAADAVRDWRWPTAGKVVRGYGQGNKGVDFQVADGSTVVASSAGKIVYAGGGLRGYRRLIIIKHDDRYLSAYSLDRDIDVREGQWVAAGKVLASPSGSQVITLHFEIRKDGDPIDPGRIIGG